MRFFFFFVVLFPAVRDTERMINRNETSFRATMHDENRQPAQSLIHPFGRKCHFPRKNIFSVANGSCDRSDGMILMAVREMRETADEEKETKTTGLGKKHPTEKSFHRYMES